MISKLATLTEINTLASNVLVFLQCCFDIQKKRLFGHFVVFCQCLKEIETSVYRGFVPKCKLRGRCCNQYLTNPLS